jgi:hypothetical protein
MVIQHKGTTIAGLLADPKAAATALQDAAFVRQLDAPTLNVLRLTVARGAPLLATSQSNP